MDSDTSKNLAEDTSESVTQMKICYDARHDGENILIYDWQGNITSTIRARLYRGLPEIVKKSEGEHIYLLPGSDQAIVINPKNLNSLSPVTDVGWYVKDKILKSNNYRIHTKWEPFFLPADSWELPTATTNSIYVVPSMKSLVYTSNEQTSHLVPLLETIIHIEPFYFGMSLCQIACALNERFQSDFNNNLYLMNYLFNFFKSKFEELCIVENIPLYKLHECSFNVTFLHNLSPRIPSSNIRAIKLLEKVYLISLSRLFSEKTYGNVPWLVWDEHEKKDLEKKAKAIVHPLAFFDSKTLLSEYKESIFFHHACIFPEITVDQTTYPAGAIIGIIEYPNRSQDTIFRGELFDGITLREQMTLILMYAAFVKRALNTSDECTDVLRNMAFEPHQMTVRKSFITAIHTALLRAR
jgi:hypothetical protein